MVRWNREANRRLVFGGWPGVGGLVGSHGSVCGVSIPHADVLAADIVQGV